MYDPNKTNRKVMTETTTSNTSKDKLIELISPLVEPLGYEIVYLEAQTQREKILRIYIDHLESSKGIGIEDCVKVSKALDEPLDLIPEVAKVFPNSFELEVSSPGIDRPLRTPKDYTRFSGRDARINLFRPLTAEEIGNAGYLAKNPKQKHFLGTLMGFQDGKVRLAIKTGPAEKKGKAKKAKSNTNSAEEITIPLPLISKANLEPDFDLTNSGKEEEKESQS